MKKILLFLSVVMGLLVCSTPAKAIKVYYNNPNSWAAVNAYIYDPDEAQAWPGAAMTKDAATNYYSIDVPAGFENSKVIFNNNNQGSQYPAVNGLQLSGNSMICIQEGNNSLWTKYETEAFKVYFDNSYANWSTVKIHYWGNCTGSNWDSRPTMTKIEGTDYWEYEVPAGTGGIKFTDAGSNASGNLAAVKNHVYSNTKDLGIEYVAPSNDPLTVYFDNFSTGWEVPYVYYWGGASTNTYPGTAMTAVTGKPGIYSFTLPARTKNIIYSAGGENADATKTGDLIAVDGHIYTTAGDAGEYASYVRNVNAPATLYLLTNQGVEAMSPAVGTAMTKSGNTFTVADVEITAATLGGTTGYFTFATKTGATWDVVNTGDRYGAATENAALTEGVGTVVKYAAGGAAAGAKSWVVAPGTYTFTVDFEAMTVTVAGTAITAGSGTINVPDVEVQAGKDGELKFNLVTESDIVGMQLDIALPNVVIASQPVLATAITEHDIQGNTVNGKYRVIIKSNANKVIPVKDGTIFTLPISALINAEEGEYDITLSDIVLSDKNLLSATLETGTIGKITITAPDTDAAIQLVDTEGDAVEEVALQLGETKTLKLMNIEDPANPVEIAAGIVWTSSDTNVATVDNGIITAVGNGTATVSATYGGSKVSTNVTVGKKSQTITWDQVLQDQYDIADEITLSATASSGLPVTFAIVNGAAYATLTGNTTDGFKLTATAAGVVTLQARQAGDDEYAPANPVTRTVTVWLGYYPGDINGDTYITLADATGTINHILGRTPDGFVAKAADLNGDSKVNIVDVTLIIDLVLKNTRPQPSPAPAHRAGSEDLEKFTIKGLDDSMLRISFSNMDKYVATQFDLVLPEGVEVTSAMIYGSDHKVSFRNNEASSRVVAYSDNNFEFSNTGYIVVMLNRELSGNVSLNNALVNSVNGNNIVEAPAIGAEFATTGIETVEAEVEAEATYYNLQGIRVAQPAEGVYIKVVGGKATKVLVK